MHLSMSGSNHLPGSLETANGEASFDNVMVAAQVHDHSIAPSCCAPPGSSIYPGNTAITTAPASGQGFGLVNGQVLPVAQDGPVGHGGGGQPSFYPQQQPPFIMHGGVVSTHAQPASMSFMRPAMYQPQQMAMAAQMQNGSRALEPRVYSRQPM